jgi:hypothetical protein
VKTPLLMSKLPLILVAILIHKVLYMAAYSENDLATATTIVQSLLDGPQQIEFVENLSIQDIESNALRFLEDLIILDYLKLDVPALKIGKENIPLALPDIIRSISPAYPFYFDEFRRYPREILRDLVRIYWDREFGEYTTISRQEARETFQRLASEFLALRIARLRTLDEERSNLRNLFFVNVFRRVRGARIASPGCVFTVTTNSPGLRVWWSGGYIISPNFFGHPTSPTSSILQSGNYVFGVDGGAYGTTGKQWDTSGMVTLPGTPSYHLNY